MAAQAAVRRSLAKRLPLYAYAQLDAGSRGSAAAAPSSGASSSGSSSAPARRGAVGPKEREALKWYGALSAQSGAPSAGGVRKVSSAKGADGRVASRPARARA